jgi:hypothetical protein
MGEVLQKQEKWDEAASICTSTTFTADSRFTSCSSGLITSDRREL